MRNPEGGPTIPTEKKPFAFDLSREYELIGRHGDAYKPFFFEQAAYYAKESYGKVPIVQYEHDIMINEEGRARLTFGADGRDAVQSYLEPVRDTSFPEWFRRRALADAQWAEAMNTELITARPGDLYIDLSPTEYNVSLEEREKWGFGVHSFLRIHTFTHENGKPKLVSRSLRNYLDEPEQARLYTQLTGEAAPAGELLGRAAKLPGDMQVGHMQHIIDNLYAETPDERKLRPLEGDQIEKNNEEMDEILISLEPWLERIYQMMEQRVSKFAILKEFHGWENAVKAAVKGELVDPAIFINLKQLYLYNDSLSLPVPLLGYVNQGYSPGSNGCGLGSGFGDMGGGVSFFSGRSGSTVTYNGPMSYLGMSAAEAVAAENYTGANAKLDWRLCRCSGEAHFHCDGGAGNCRQAIVVGKGIVECPSCGKGKTC